jgi:hypothetical protein
LPAATGWQPVPPELDLCVNHPGILAEEWKKLAFATNAIFLRFPNKKPEKPTLAKFFYLE